MQREHRRLTSLKRQMLVAGAAVSASAVLAANAQADTYTVTGTTDDPSAVDPSCTQVAGTTDHWTCTTLRDALAQTNPHVAANPADTIDLTGLSGTLTLGAELPVSNGNTLTITGPGAATLSVSGDANSRVFNISSPTNTAITVSGLTITDGTPGGSGGAIFNRASQGFNGASLSLTNDVISGSTASGRGGGVFSGGPLTVSASTISGNTASGRGGGIYVQGTLSMDGSTVSGNTGGDGGGIAVASKYGTTITNSVVSGNTAKSGEGSSYGGGLWLQASGRFALSGINSGAAINNPNNPIVIRNSTFSNNHAAAGAGIDIERDSAPNSPITIAASTLSGNHGTGTTSEGGGLAIYHAIANPVDVIDSTISGNDAVDGGGVSIGYNGDSSSSYYQVLTGTNGSIAFDNSTIDGNTASRNGGGIFLSQYASSQASAPVNNAPTTPQYSSATAGLNSTIVAGNKAGSDNQDLFRPATSSSGGFNANYSLIQATDPALLLTKNQTILGVDSQLGALGNNGGPTQTMLPADASPAIDQGKAASGLTTDQRGDARTVDRGKSKPPGGDGTDIGAVELPAIVKVGSAASAPTPISALVGPASGITSTHATLNGKITTNGVAVTWHFQWGRTTGYGQTTPSQSISAGHGQVPVSFQVKGLSPGTVYHYRVVALGSSGQTATSSDAMFKTPAPTIKDHPGAVRGGQKVRVFGRAGGCPTGDRVTLISGAFSSAHQFAGQNAIYATVLRGDRYSTMTTIPANRIPDRYAITGRCGGGNFGVTAFLRVLPVKHVKAVKVTFTG